jgi:hypothetical protein
MQAVMPSGTTWRAGCPSGGWARIKPTRAEQLQNIYEYIYEKLRVTKILSHNRFENPTPQGGRISEAKIYKFDEAEDFYKRALDIYKNSAGHIADPGNPNLITDKEN